MLLALLGSTCSSNTYTPPTEAETGTIVLSSTCTRRARFYARINRQRTETYGCNQTARWPVTPGRVHLLVQVEESQYAIDPLEIEIEMAAGQCANFLLRQGLGYDLEFFGVGECR